jgi:hypothetical protein
MYAVQEELQKFLDRLDWSSQKGHLYRAEISKRLEYEQFDLLRHEVLPLDPATQLNHNQQSAKSPTLLRAYEKASLILRAHTLRRLTRETVGLPHRRL